VRWSLSYRVRAIVLVALLTCAAIAATAWISTRSTVAQLADSVDSQQADIDLIATQLQRYGIVHGVWIGVPALTLQLETATSQRIKLTTQDGQVIVDTDNLHGRAARPVADRSPVAIVPRPTLDLTGLDPMRAYAVTMAAIVDYRVDARMAACLTEAGIPITSTADRYGVPSIGYDAAAAAAAGCVAAKPTGAELAADTDGGGLCVKQLYTSPVPTGKPTVVRAPSDADTCLSTLFQQHTADVDAVTLLLFTGYRGGPTLHVDYQRIALAAIPIVLAAIIGGALLSRHVLRPVDAVIRASRRLSSGQRDARVPERGHDEMTALARAFNRMADAVQTGDDRQRQLTADIAHELRTPLANIRGYLEALSDGVLEPTPEVFASLHEEAMLQQRTIDDLQDLALADRHRLIDHRVRVDVGDLARTAVAVHTARADAAGVTLTVHAPADLVVDGDPDRLRQAVGNLLTNALRATPPGGRIEVRAAADGAATVRVAVADTGHGIEPEHLPHIFDRFWRADPARGRDTGGTGLGLAITRGIVDGHGGTLHVESAPGAGTTVTITLPRDPLPAQRDPLPG
jgi:two-component system sensor histidine kinase BaeS